MAVSKIVFPPCLNKGAVIGITCPAGYMPIEKTEDCVRTLKEWGYHVVIGKTIGQQYNYFSGTDEQRLDELQQMLNDPAIDAILFGRGGYGISRIIDKIDFRAFRKNPKWLIGFSDVTLLHTHIHRQFHIATMHAPMAGAFRDGGYKNQYIGSLHKALTGKKASYNSSVHELNRKGKGEGQLIGGNLTMLAHACGTSSGIQTDGKILFIEDTGEYLYNIDRMLIQLKRNSALNKLAGFVVGGFDSMKDTTVPFGKTLEEIILDAINEFDYPVCFGFPVSHETANVALKIGATYRLIVSGKNVSLKEK
ncbi:LD-carboxypeptidase [Pollutibacter soli]|uniref:S66 peptidase family protein n=1 Tax=Pollutibacter soli TaxID=3034157 RepID=UPI0030138B37